MIKIVGLIIIFLCALYGGKLAGERYKTHVQALNEFIAMIKFIMQRIEYFRTPIYEIFNMYKESSRGSLLDNSGFLDEIQKSNWNITLKKLRKLLYLNENEYNILYGFGNELGTSGTDEQVKNCEYCIAQLENEYEKARASLSKEVRLSSSLSISIGLMIIIILI